MKQNNATTKGGKPNSGGRREAGIPSKTMTRQKAGIPSSKLNPITKRIVLINSTNSNLFAEFLR